MTRTLVQVIFRLSPEVLKLRAPGPVPLSEHPPVTWVALKFERRSPYMTREVPLLMMKTETSFEWLTAEH